MPFEININIIKCFNFVRVTQLFKEFEFIIEDQNAYYNLIKLLGKYKIYKIN